MFRCIVTIFLTLLITVKSQKNLIDSNNKLAIDLLNVFPTDDNNFFSPLSISSTLLMLLNGANGITEKELQSILNIEDKSKLDSINKDMKTILKSISEKDNDKLTARLANLLLVSNAFPLKNSYQNLMRDNFDSSIESVDFAQNSAKITKDINDWVSEQTSGKINPLFKENLTGDTIMVLVNAIYFKGLWEKPFRSENTAKNDFYNMGNINPVKVDMMSTNGEFRVISDTELNAKLLELPFSSGSNMSMIILLPDQIDGLDDMTKKLTLNILRHQILFVKGGRKVSTRLFFPKFKLETEYGLRESLESLGVKSLFQDSADLSGINGQNNMKVSKAIHKASIQVSEEGAEAGAATGISTVIKSSKYRETRVDRPFIFLIIDNTNDLITFLGQVRKIL